MNFGHDVLPIDEYRGALRRAQGDVENRPFLGDIDLVASKHRVDALSEA